MERSTVMGSVCALVLGHGCAHHTSADRQLVREGREIHYQVRGDGDRTLVFIHGWTGNLDIWRYQLDAFPEHRVIAIDLPGHGRSSRAAPHTMESFADAVRAVLAAEGVERAFFFGHSMGFAVVEVIAVKYPHLCAGLGAIDGLHFDVPTDPAGQAEWQRTARAMAAAMTTEQAREQFIDALLLPETPPRLRDEILRASRTVPLSIGRAMMESVVDEVAFWQANKPDLPCLAVYSPAYRLPPAYRDDFARAFPRVEYHAVDNVSHFFMREIPARLNQTIADFVARH